MLTPEQPWGIVVTPTLHLIDYRDRTPVPLCGDDRVVALLEALRRQWKTLQDEHAPPELYQPAFAYADGRPVCRRCIACARRKADHFASLADEAAAHNEQVS